MLFLFLLFARVLVFFLDIRAYGLTLVASSRVRLVRFNLSRLIFIHELKKLLTEHVNLVLHLITDELLVGKHLPELLDFILSCEPIGFYTDAGVEVRRHA